MILRAFLYLLLIAALAWGGYHIYEAVSLGCIELGTRYGERVACEEFRADEFYTMLGLAITVTAASTALLWLWRPAKRKPDKDYYKP